MSTTPEFSTKLNFGLRVESDDPEWRDLFTPARRLLAPVLKVQLAWSDHGTLGGTFLEYEPRSLPERGITGVRITSNHHYDDVWAAPHRRDLPIVASIGLSTMNLLDVGRFAATVYARAGDRAALTSYVVGPHGGSTSGAELWRGHGAEFMTDDAGTCSWTPERSPIGDDIRWNATAVAPVLVGYVTFAVRAADWAAALAATQRAFPVPFVAGFDEDIGGDHHLYEASDGSSVLLRRNLFYEHIRPIDDRKDVDFVLNVTMRTQSLLDLGRLAASLEAHGDFEAIEYRAVGNLLHDRVQRVLKGRADHIKAQQTAGARADKQ